MSIKGGGESVLWEEVEVTLPPTTSVDQDTFLTWWCHSVWK